MQKRKTLLRRIVMDILTRREQVNYECNQFAFLRLVVKEVLVRRRTRRSRKMMNNSNHDLPDEDDTLLLEYFWICSWKRSSRSSHTVAHRIRGQQFSF